MCFWHLVYNYKMICFCFFQAIYNMLGSNLSNNELDTPAERTEKIFDKMDLNNDGVLTKKEFVEGCMKDQFLYQMLTADACQNQWWSFFLKILSVCLKIFQVIKTFCFLKFFFYSYGKEVPSGSWWDQQFLSKQK